MLLNYDKATLGKSLILDEVKSEHNLNLYAQWFLDPSKSLSLSEIRSLPASQFKANLGENPNLGYISSVMWLRFTVKNTSSKPTWLLEMACRDLLLLTNSTWAARPVALNLDMRLR